MQFNRRPPLMSSALKTLTAAVASAVLMASSAQAAGLGKLTVLSALGQPLRAEIELTAVAEDEASGLSAKLASTEAFRVANIEFNPALLSLRFNVEQRNGRQLIRISSTQPLNEPFVDLLLELSWNNGKLVREYTFLLDPAELRATQSAQVAPTEVPTRARPAQQQAAAPEAAPARAAEPKQRTEDGYRVKPGDTLGRIAAKVKPEGISLDMMLVALYRANPDAFFGHNMNRLRSGQILSVPDNDAIHATGAAEARSMVVAHAADFNAYRNKLAGQVASSEAVKVPQAGQSASGKIGAKVQERPTAANESPDQLHLSKAALAAANGGKGSAASSEDMIAKQKALADAQARVRELEKNVTDLEKLVTVKNQAGAAAAATAQQEAAKPAASAPAKPAAATPAKPPVKPVAKPVQPKPPVKAAPAEPGLVDMLMDNITYVGGGLLVLALAALGISQRKKRAAKDDEEQGHEPSLLGVPTEHAVTMFAEAGGQSVDTTNSVFNSSFAPSASQLDTNEVDPVAEADVYIAYGRDVQAEEILKEALRANHDRHPVRLKLLEIYAARKDQRAFEGQAAELYGMTRGEGDEWAQAAALGLSIDPLNPLYAGGGGTPALSDEEQAQHALLSQEFSHGMISDNEPRPAIDEDFRLHTPAEDATALPQEPAAQHEAKDDEHVLDFDLGGLSFEPVSSGEAIAMPGPDATSAPELPDFSLDEAEQPAVDALAVHDLEFNIEPLAATAPSTAAEDLKPAEAAEDKAFDLAFDMDFSAPAAAQAEEDPLAFDRAAAVAPALDIADLAKEFDLPELPQASEAAVEKHEESSFDLDNMDFGIAPTPAAPHAPAAEQERFALPEMNLTPAAAPGFDLSDIDLDLPAGEAPMPEVVLAGDAEMSADHMEMETKLDLAIAYQEIGDKDGARELLEEVIKGGNSEQVSKAHALREKLA